MNYNFYGMSQPQQLRLEKVANIEEAKRYPVMNGQTIYLLDSDKPIIYVKTVSGLMGYELKPIDISGSNFITKDDLSNFKKEIMEVLNNVKSTTSATNESV